MNINRTNIADADGIWTIDLKIRIGYCRTNCNIAMNRILKQIIYDDINTRLTNVLNILYK